MKETKVGLISAFLRKTYDHQRATGTMRASEWAMSVVDIPKTARNMARARAFKQLSPEQVKEALGAVKVKADE